MVAIPRITNVTVYCASRSGNHPAYRAAATRIGELLAAAGMTLVYGGGKVGLMGAVADAMLGAGGRVVGVIPEFLMQREVGHPGCSELEIVASMHARKLRLFELADAILVLPGGLGTLDETIEVLGWHGLGTHAKRVILIDVNGYWQPLVRLLAHAIGHGFVTGPLSDFIEVVATPEAALARLRGEAVAD